MDVIEVGVERFRAVRDVVIFVGFRVNVESEGEFAVALETSAFVVALERFGLVSFIGLCGPAFGFLLDALAVTSNINLVLTGLIFLTWERRVTLCFVWMTTGLLFSAWLGALCACVFAFAGSVTWLSAEVRSALELLATDLSASNVDKPAWLILELMLAAKAGLGDQEWAFRACQIGRAHV